MQRKPRFEGKVCVVTASSTGIGLAISEQLASEGAIVVINSRSEKNVTEAVKQIKAKGFKAEGLVCHAGKLEDIKKLIQFVETKFGRLDILVTNAAVSTHVGPTITLTPQQFDKMFDVNVRGTLFLIQEAHPLLQVYFINNNYIQKTPKSNVVIISSYAGYELEPGLGFYSVTKTTLIALSKILSKELQGDNIRVNCIAPGIIKTNFSSLLWKDKEKEIESSMKINRLGEVQDIAYAVAFIASEEASYVNGETLVVAGKPSARL